MIRPILRALPLLIAASSAQAGWEIGGGLEHYEWTEYPDAPSSMPKEAGTRSALFLGWTQEGKRGVLFSWRAKVYGGMVNYDTYSMSTGAPVTTKTDYSGVANEAQLLYRDDLGRYRVDYLGGLGLDYWRRSIGNASSAQIEDYSLAFLRAGVRLAKPGLEPGLHVECGIKRPFWTREDAHLTSLYSPAGATLTSNPGISPRGEISGYAEIGYRIDADIDLTGYYDSWRLGRSGDVMATDALGNLWLVYQPKSSMNAFGIKLLVTL